MASLKYLRQQLSKEAYEQIEKEYPKKTRTRNTGTSPDLERDSCNKQMEEKKTPRFNGQVHIRSVTVRRCKPRDRKAISDKYAIDSLVSSGILPDDSEKYVPEDPKVEVLCGIPEMTIIEIEEI